MKPGDVIIEYNGRPVKNTTELQKMVGATKPGTSVPVKVMRNGKEQTLHATVEELDLEAERGGRPGQNNERQQPEEQGRTASASRWATSRRRWRAGCSCLRAQSGAVVTDVDDNGRRPGSCAPATSSSR